MRRNIVFKIMIMFFFITSPLLMKAQAAHQSDISITDFRIAINEHKVNINWSTDKMKTTNYFEVEKSNDGKKFKTVAYVLGADPAKNDSESYGCVDKIKKSTDRYYYRIKHIDEDGGVEFSEIKMLALK